MSGLNVLVVGASIAGPVAAYWLAKAGANVTVIERFPSLRTGGQNVDIRTSGVTVMRRTKGMEEAVRAKIPKWDGIQLVDGNGKAFVTMAQTGNPDSQSLLSEFEIFRGDLSKILYDLSLETGRVKYVFGEQVASIQQNEKVAGPVKVEFANGYPTTEYDLVVACDGATSRTRAIGLGCGVRDHISTTNSWWAFFTSKEDFLHGGRMNKGHTAPACMYGIAQNPTGGNRVAMMGIYPQKDPTATLPFQEAQKESTDALKQFVAKHFAKSGWKKDEVIKAMLESEDFYASESVQVKVPNLYKGRFVLLGDAGYAVGPTGLGTSAALTGAYVLAGEIGAHKGDLAAGLAAYEARMRPIIADAQSIPPGVPWIIAPQTAWGVYIRDTIFMVASNVAAYGKYLSWIGPLFSSVGNVWSSAFGGDKHQLPEYAWAPQDLPQAG